MSVIASIRHKSDNVACIIDDWCYIAAHSFVIAAFLWGMYLMARMVIHDFRIFL